MYRVGDTVRLKCSCLGNPVGTRGVCYEVYSLSGYTGASFIFENGNYDGFSEHEQEDFLESDGHVNTLADYQFSHVINLCNDFHKGYFNKAIGRTEEFLKQQQQKLPESQQPVQKQVDLSQYGDGFED